MSDYSHLPKLPYILQPARNRTYLLALETGIIVTPPQISAACLSSSCLVTNFNCFATKFIFQPSDVPVQSKLQHFPFWVPNHLGKGLNDFSQRICLIDNRFNYFILNQLLQVSRILRISSGQFSGRDLLVTWERCPCRKKAFARNRGVEIHPFSHFHRVDGF